MRNEYYQKQWSPSQEAHDGSFLSDLVRLQRVKLNNDPVFGQTKFSGQKLKDLGTVFLILVSSVGHTYSGHRQHHTRRARASYQNWQPGLHHQVHPVLWFSQSSRGA